MSPTILRAFTSRPILGPWISNIPPIFGAFISMSTLGNPILGPWISNTSSNLGVHEYQALVRLF